MKTIEQLDLVEDSLAFYEQKISVDLSAGNFESAKSHYDELNGALWIAQRLKLLSEQAAKARAQAAFQRYLDAKYADPERGGGA